MIDSAASIPAFAMQPRRDGVLACPSVPQLFADLEPVGFFFANNLIGGPRGGTRGFGDRNYQPRKLIIGSARSFSPFRRHDETRNQLREMGAAVAGFLSAILT